MRIERADKRYQPLHLLWLVIEPAVYLRVADKPPVTQRLQRARAYSQLPADLLAREPSFHAPRVAFAPQGGDLLRECAECRHHHLESLFLDRYYFHIHAIIGLPAKVTIQPLTRTVFR